MKCVIVLFFDGDGQLLCYLISKFLLLRNNKRMLFQRKFGITVKIGHVLSIFQSAIIDNTLVMSVITLVPFVSITKNIVFIKAHTTDPFPFLRSTKSTSRCTSIILHLSQSRTFLRRLKLAHTFYCNIIHKSTSCTFLSRMKLAHNLSCYIIHPSKSCTFLRRMKLAHTFSCYIIHPSTSCMFLRRLKLAHAFSFYIILRARLARCCTALESRIAVAVVLFKRSRLARLFSRAFLFLRSSRDSPSLKGLESCLGIVLM